MLCNDHRVAEQMSTLIRGHDYRRGIDVFLTGAQWRSLLSETAYTRRIGSGVLAFDRREGNTSLAFEIYDDDGVIGAQRRGMRM
jgi:hypothetical protein